MVCVAGSSVLKLAGKVVIVGSVEFWKLVGFAIVFVLLFASTCVV